MVATTTEMSVKTSTKVGYTTLEVDNSLESTIEMIVFQAKIATVDRAKWSKMVDYAMKEAIIHLE